MQGSVGSIKTKDKKKKRFFSKEALYKNSLYYFFIILCLLITAMTDKFLTYSNIVQVLRQISLQAIIAIGMTMIIILGQIDLSVGSIVAFSAVVNALLMKIGIPIPLAILLSLVAGGMIGGINGFVTAKYKLHSFLVTLAMMTIMRGVTFTLTNGYPISDLPKAFFNFGAGYMLGIPYPVIYMLILYGVGIFVLEWTPFGRKIYALGGNTEAARLSGININFIKVAVFTITGVLSAVAGVVLSSRLMSGSPSVGVGWELDVIAAVIIGGTNMSGGEGKLTGTLMGMLVIGVLINGMILLGVSPYMQQVVRGGVILVAVIINSLEKNRA